MQVPILSAGEYGVLVLRGEGSTWTYECLELSTGECVTATLTILASPCEWASGCDAAYMGAGDGCDCLADLTLCPDADCPPLPTPSGGDTCFTGIGTHYEGFAATTISGHTCQSWF